MGGMRQGIECELMLWKASYDSQIGGRLIFEVSKDELEPFYGLPTKKGGQRFAAVLVLIGDDEKPVAHDVPDTILKPTKRVEQEVAAVLNAGTSVAYASNVAAVSVAPAGPTIAEAAAERKSKPHIPGGFCGLAVLWCDDVQFREWIGMEFQSVWESTAQMVRLINKTADIERAAHAIKIICGVTSRKDLDTEPARSKFEEMIRAPYMAYLKEGA
jgi:hypothetical protein